MTIEKKIENERVIIAIAGRLDTTTAPELEKQLGCVFENVKKPDF